jgi:hypothetical protein
MKKETIKELKKQEQQLYNKSMQLHREGRAIADKIRKLEAVGTQNYKGKCVHFKQSGYDYYMKIRGVDKWGRAIGKQLCKDKHICNFWDAGSVYQENLKKAKILSEKEFKQAIKKVFDREKKNWLK